MIKPKRVKSLSELIGALVYFIPKQKLKKEIKKARKALSPTTMFDSIELDMIPSTARAVAGYTGGRWPTYAAVVKRFPNARHVSIAISASEKANCLDVETGDATPYEAATWAERELRDDPKSRPILYGSRSTMEVIQTVLRASKITRSQVRLWIADPTGKPHIPPGFDACQFNWHALGRNLDQSELRGDFWDE